MKLVLKRLKHTLLVAAAVTVAATLASCNVDDEIIGGDDNNGSAVNPPQQGVPDVSVIEWRPAPGQWIGETRTGGMTTPITTQQEADSWAQERIDAGNFVSLGGFGGYIIFGFSHSLANGGDYDFAVVGNAFVNGPQNGSNEPGIVYVMRDTNGNGLPDDVWYELRASESDNPATVRGYAVTYYRPEADGQDVSWTDNAGNSGTIDYLAAFHSQPSYYPEWIQAESYTLTGTCIPAATSLDPEIGMWNNRPFGWGYADNCGSDNLEDVRPQQSRFRISDAMDEAGNAVALPCIDFVKVQTAVNSKAGWLGEVSTEVCGLLVL